MNDTVKRIDIEIDTWDKRLDTIHALLKLSVESKSYVDIASYTQQMREYNGVMQGLFIAKQIIEGAWDNENE